MQFVLVGSIFLVHLHCSPTFSMDRHLATTVSNCSKLSPHFVHFFAILHRWWWIRRLRSTLVPQFATSQASSLFFIVRQLSFEDCRLKDEEQTTIFAAGKPCIVAPEEYATRPRRYSSFLSANEKRMSQ